tara:strand:+ start:98 stop:262 length:165 start_codon:yes stop_codon:yes gene_type:complete
MAKKTTTPESGETNNNNKIWRDIHRNAVKSAAGRKVGWRAKKAKEFELPIDRQQ